MVAVPGAKDIVGVPPISMYKQSIYILLRILTTQWVGEAWELLSNDLKGSIVRSFRKCGITIALDGSEDVILILEDWKNTVGTQSSESEDTSSASTDEYEPGSNSGDEDAGGERDAVGEKDAVGGEVQQ
ncbi:hypothetical protein BGX38DRAFT_1272137 [Terfezia claveryi]|nr:hypothetical protein BGX38DRAFT_1272137 [Terfezia claveryi]